MPQPNIDYWTGDQVAGYERKQRLLVPRKDELLDTIVDPVPFDEKHEFCVVDERSSRRSKSASTRAFRVSCGEGALTHPPHGRNPSRSA